MNPLTPEQIATYDQDRSAQYVAGMVVCTVMVVVSTVLRFYAQYLVQTLGTLDNYLIILACVCLLKRSNQSELGIYNGEKF
jgi:cobalamin biosynthesis protein CobD/CbiB